MPPVILWGTETKVKGSRLGSGGPQVVLRIMVLYSRMQSHQRAAGLNDVKGCVLKALAGSYKENRLAEVCGRGFKAGPAI
jgi:hypothetical protein